jgi:hypothetical protein
MDASNSNEEEEIEVNQSEVVQEAIQYFLINEEI